MEVRWVRATVFLGKRPTITSSTGPSVKEHPIPVIHWFRRDLRLDDNTALAAARERAAEAMPSFVLDPLLRPSLCLADGAACRPGIGPFSRLSWDSLARSSILDGGVLPLALSLMRPAAYIMREFRLQGEPQGTHVTARRHL